MRIQLVKVEFAGGPLGELEQVVVNNGWPLAGWWRIEPAARWI